jgi:hypothetical protein
MHITVAACTSTSSGRPTPPSTAAPPGTARPTNAAISATPATTLSTSTLRARPVTSSVPLGRGTVVLTNVEISATAAATFEQIHPSPGNIIVSTTSPLDLIACPGGWHGLAVRSGPGAWGPAWLGEDCIRFNAASPARLPPVSTTNQHYAIAVVSANGELSVPELRVVYQPGDDDGAICYVAEVERACQ